MKRLCSAILAVCLIVGIAVPAHAADGAETDTPPESAEVVTVSTVAELIEAIEAAKDGDTIAISQKILVGGETIFCDKDITIIRADDFVKGEMFCFIGGTISGLKFKETIPKPEYAGYSAHLMIDVVDGEKTTFENCVFDGGEVSTAVHVCGYSNQCNAQFRNCEFTNCYKYAIWGNPSSVIVANSCSIHDTFAGSANGAVTSSGSLTLTDCTITGNTSVANAGVMCSGILVINNCQIKDNSVTNIYNKVAVDIFCNGVWSITDEPHQNAGYYDITTGAKIKLPVSGSSALAKLIYLNDAEAADYFAPAPDDDDTNNEPPEPPQESQTPEEGENTVEPNEPPEDTTEDNTTTAPPEPPKSDDDDEDDYTPPTSHKPVHRPSKPNTVTPEPETAPALACGDAIIDVSRSVVLLGYGDGLLHLEDYLTRAQMAAIIYRLLDDTSVEDYDIRDSVFDDVSPDAWYCRYVSTIARAGIVFGVGSGKYNPDAPLTWGHIITVLSRFVEAEEYELQNIQYDGWALNAVKTAVALGWIEDYVSFNPDAYITRGEFVAFMNSILEKYR